MRVDLFGDPAGEPEHSISGSRDDRWRLTDHACSFCGGRVLWRETARGRRQFRCSECGQTGEVRVETLCCCGVRDADGRRLLECVRNPDRLPGRSMAEIAVREWKGPD